MSVTLAPELAEAIKDRIVAAAKRRLEAEAHGGSGDEDALSRRKNR
jgi:hypothetical protein